MIGTELDLVTVFGGGSGQSHDTCIVDENVKSLGIGVESIGSLFHRLERSQVEV